MSQVAYPSSGASLDAPLEAFWFKLSARGRHNRRSCPRVHANVPVCFDVTPSGTVETTSNDLSRYGMQVRCNRTTANLLRPASGGTAAKRTYPLVIQLEISGLALRVGAQGRIMHLTLVPDAAPGEEVAIGVEFLSFEAGGADVLQAFVEQHLCPAGL